MNSALAFEIYRGVWLIHGSKDSFGNILGEARNAIYDPSQRLNTFVLKGISASGHTVAASNTSSKSEKKISYTNISGVITKSGGASSYGMQEISADMIAADNTDDVIGHFVKLDTPGGSAAAMWYMKQTIKSLNKPVVTMVSRQGMAASAGLGILVEGDYVMSESDDAEIGSHGVMWGVSGVPNGQKDGNGEVNFIVISSGSPDKNKATEAAINNNDTSLMQKEVDRIDDQFKASTKNKRPDAKDDQMTGNMYLASEVVGTFIDAIGSEQDALNKILELSKTNSKFNANIKNDKKQAMKAEEIKAQFPETYTAIFSAGEAQGLAAEQDRVKSWSVYKDVDPAAVAAGIASGKQIAGSEREAFLLKASSANTLVKLKEASNKDIVVEESVTDPKAVVTEEAKADLATIDSVYGKFLKKPLAN